MLYDYHKNPSNCTTSWIESDVTRGIRYLILSQNGKSTDCVEVESQGGDVCYLERFSILPEMRGNHHGIGLVRHARGYALSKGASKVGIGAIDEQAELKDWCRYLGFIEKKTRSFPHLPFRVCFMETDLKRSAGK